MTLLDLRSREHPHGPGDRAGHPIQQMTRSLPAPAAVTHGALLPATICGGRYGNGCQRRRYDIGQRHACPDQHGIQVHNASGGWTLNQVKVQ